MGSYDPQPDDAPEAPRHTQLMDPAADPQEFIEASIYWYPLIFPTRTEVLDHLLMGGGNGYEWGRDGNPRSVFSHIEPDYDKLDSYEADARKEDEKYGPGAEYSMAGYYREEHRRLLAIRAEYKERSRTLGPVRLTYRGPDGVMARTIGSIEFQSTLMRKMPANVIPAWREVIEEARALFAPLLVEQGTLW